MKREDKFKPHFECLYPPFADKMRELGRVLDEYWMPYCGFRSFENQKKLYALGRTGPGKIVTSARPGLSYHNYGLACDWAYFRDGFDPWNHAMWVDLGRAVEEVGGLEWGGDWTHFKDKPHVQLKINAPISALLDTFNKSGLNAVWQLIEGE
jgi:peptidoglycan L-alanyl-D-glutamate endopeptidase CwlK